MPQGSAPGVACPQLACRAAHHQENAAVFEIPGNLAMLGIRVAERFHFGPLKIARDDDDLVTLVGGDR